MPGSWFTSNITGGPVRLPIDAPTIMQPPSPYGTWQWSTARKRHIPIERAAFELHPLRDTDPRMIRISNHETVDLPRPTFLLWRPQCAPSERLRHVGLVAIAQGGGSTWKEGIPDLFLDGEPFTFMRNATPSSLYEWMKLYLAGRETVWFTYEGKSLWQLMAVYKENRADSRVLVDVERAL